MKTFNLDTFLKTINTSIIELGHQYFIDNKVNQLTYKEIDNIYHIKSVTNGYQVKCSVKDNTFIDYSCECNQCMKYKIVCKHIVATLYKFNEAINVKIKNDFKAYEKIVDHNYYDLYQWILSLDEIMMIEFSNNSFKFKLVDQFHKLTDVYLNFKEVIDETYKNHPQDKSLKKVYDILNELALFHVFNYDEDNLYEGDDIDKIFDIFQSHEFQYVSFKQFNESLNHAQLIDSDKQKLVIKGELYKTTFDYHFSTNLLLVDFIFSNDFTYLLFKENEMNSIIYKVPYADAKRYKVFKKNLVTSKKEDLIDQKIDYIKTLDEFDLEIANYMHEREVKKIDVSFEYDANKKSIILKVHPNFINQQLLNEMLIKKFGSVYDNFYDHKETCFVFKNNQDFDKFSKSFLDDDTFTFIYPTYFFKKQLDFDLNFKVKDEDISFNLVNDLINTNEKFEMLKKAYDNNEKFISINNQVYLVSDFNLEAIKEQFAKYNINDIYYQDNIIDFKNIFTLSKEINDVEIKNYVKKIENIKVDVDLEPDILSLLKPYQLEGIKWVKKNLMLFHGCILADEMGLGKTLQTLCLLKDYFATPRKNKNILIIAPSILCKNWISELIKFDLGLEIINLTGNRNKRSDTLKKNKDNNKIFITTYSQFVNDYNELNQVVFEYIILDEGQKIKNVNSLVSKRVRTLRGINHLILSGTPIENNLLELWTIFDFILPGYLLPLSKFKKLYFNKKVTKSDLDFLNLQTSPFILKRTKEEKLKELPKKTIHEIFIDMSEEEKQAYADLINLSRQEFATLDKKDSLNVLSIITKLRMFVCSNDYGNSKQEKMFELIREIIKQQSKVVVFCFFSSILEKISLELNELGIKNEVLIGKTTNRWDIINRFNSSSTQVILCSLKTGGIGINLTAANYVINLSPWWNESSENQAIDRTYRIGQNKDVIVYKLIANDTIEVDINKLKKQKTILIDNVINQIDYYELLKNVFKKK